MSHSVDIPLDNTKWPSQETFEQVLEHKNINQLKNHFQSSKHLLDALDTNLERGITTDSIPDRVTTYGKNQLPPPIMKSYFQFLWIAMKERMVLFLLLAAIITVAVGLYETIEGERNAWLEGVAILAAIAIITGVQSINDHRKQARFRKLNDTNKALRTVKIIRDGRILQASVKDIVVGDIISISMGDILSCDGILLQSNSLRTDESTMTGESRQIDKIGLIDLESQRQSKEEQGNTVNVTQPSEDTTEVNDVFLFSGTTVVNGNGKVLVLLVGENSNEGKMMRNLRVDPPPTPLQLKLAHLAKRLATIGLIVAVITLGVLLGLYFLKGSPGPILDGLIAILLIGISIIVMAIPEGLPLAVTLALAYATIHMLKDNNLVRHLNACETMGGATTVCSDKTGTLTINKMTVVRARIFNMHYVHDAADAVEIMRHLSNLSEFDRWCTDGVIINTDAYEAMVAEKMTFLGSQTEIALLEWLRLVRKQSTTAGGGQQREEDPFDYEQVRKNANVVKRHPFNSDRKRSTVTVSSSNGKFKFIVYMKGASEVVLSMCNRMVSETGDIVPLDETAKEEYLVEIDDYARKSLRTICCAFKETDELDHEDEPDYILLGLFGLEDPLRTNAFDSVKQCQRAGIVVRMVTGDNAVTARSIATQCGIVKADEDADGVIIEGPAFRVMSDADVDRLLPRLRVMARSSPNDKLLLVNALIRQNETVAVTGDGANDAPALKNSHVGFSMGVSGTEVAKEASDIVLLDDNFASIVRAILWGRTIYMGIQKFIMFQLSVNISAVIITIVTAVDSGIRTGIPLAGLTTLQILLLNLIADSLAAMALSTDKPVDAYLDRLPHRRDDHIITGDMWRMIIGQSVYQISVGLLVYYVGPFFFGNDPATRGTMVYAAFVFMVIFNELNCRSVDRDYNIFRGILKNKFFLPLFFIGFVSQFIIVTYLGIIFNTVPISWSLWLVAIVLGSGSLLVGFLIRTIDRLF